MALYQNVSVVQKITDVAFDKIHKPSDPTPFSGIYKCEICGHEVISTEGHPLPPQNHNQHPVGKPIQWRLIVFAKHNATA